MRLWEKGKPIHYGALDATTSAQLIRQIGDTYTLRFDLSGAYSVMQHGAGDYEWTVALVAIEPDYQDLQIEATPYSLSLLPCVPPETEVLDRQQFPKNCLLKN